MIQKMVHGCLANTLHGWVEFVKATKHERLVLARFAAKLKFRAAAMCLATWSEYRDTRRFLRRFVTRAVGGRARNSLVAALKLWAEFSVGMRQLELEHGAQSLQELVESLSEKVQQLEAKLSLTESQLNVTQTKKSELAQRSMTRFIQQWQNKALVTTLLAWKAFARSGKDDKVKMQRFLKRMLQVFVVRCFDAWKLTHDENKRNKLVIYRVGQRMQNGLLLRVLNSWRCMIVAGKRERHIVDRISRRMMNRSVNSAVASWVEFVVLRKRLKYLALKIFNRLGNNKLLSGWMSWVALSEHYREIDRQNVELRYASESERSAELARRAEVEAKQRAGLKMIQKMVHGCLANTLHGWVTFVKIAKHERFVVHRFAKKMKNRSLMMCVATWDDFCSQRKFLRRFIKKTTSGKCTKELLGAFSTWRASTKEDVRLTGILKKFSKRLLQQSLFRCMHNWNLYVEQRIRTRKLIKFCLGGKRVMAMKSAFRLWFKGVIDCMKNYIDNCHDVELRVENDELKRRISSLEESSVVIHKLTNLLLEGAGGELGEEDVNNLLQRGGIGSSDGLFSPTVVVKFTPSHHIVSTPLRNEFKNNDSNDAMSYTQTPPSILQLRTPFKSPASAWPEDFYKIKPNQKNNEPIKFL